MSEEAMVRASVEALRRVYDAWAQGDFSSRPEMLDPNIEGVWAAELPDAHVDQGVEALFASSREWLSAWEGFRLEAEAFLPAEEKVVVLVVLHGKGKGSGAEVRRMRVVLDVVAAQVLLGRLLRLFLVDVESEEIQRGPLVLLQIVVDIRSHHGFSLPAG
jgi:hypothetical protein